MQIFKENCSAFGNPYVTVYLCTRIQSNIKKVGMGAVRV